MRTKLLLLILIVSLLAALLPAAALAAAPAEIKVFVRNNTAAVANLKLVDSAGNPIYIDLEPGLSEFSLEEGQYAWYASTICGANAGNWNMNTTKTLYLECKEDGSPVVQYGKCQYILYPWYTKEAFGIKPQGNVSANVEIVFKVHKEAVSAEYLYNRFRAAGFDWTFDEFLDRIGADVVCAYGVLPEDLSGGIHLPRPTN